MPALDPASFRHRYGPWALIAGASEGTGAAFARQAAAAGLNCVLVARRTEPLDALATELHENHKVEVRTIVQDLAKPGAADHLASTCADLEVGLFVSNAGSDSTGSQFLDAPLNAWRGLVDRNIRTLMESVYAFAPPMKARRRGGMVLMSSGTALGGQTRLAVYSASKAFDLNFAESLWSELGPHGVDVLAVVAPAMDTPMMRQLLASKNLPADGLFEPEDVVSQALARLPDGPTLLFPYGPEAAEVDRMTEARRERVKMVAEFSKRFFGDM
jgi:short-subunit dehydrogenase